MTGDGFRRWKEGEIARLKAVVSALQTRPHFSAAVQLCVASAAHLPDLARQNRGFRALLTCCTAPGDIAQEPIDMRVPEGTASPPSPHRPLATHRRPSLALFSSFHMPLLVLTPR